MKEYQKIQTVFKRDPETNHKKLLMGDYSLPEFEYLKDNMWEFTEKVDGTNIRVMFDGERITFGGKTDKAQIPAKLVEKLEGMFLPQLQGFKDIFDEEACLYGEGYGGYIQSAGKLYGEIDFILFDVKIGKWWLKRADIQDIANDFGIDVVPIIGEGTLDDLMNSVSFGFSSNWGDFTAEGVVARPKVDLLSRSGSRVITKLKHKDF